MIKISFCFKEPDAEQGSLEYATIDNPKKSREGKLAGVYACEVCLPILNKEIHIIYSSNPIDAVVNATEFVKNQLQFFIDRGCVISEVESHELWKLEKKSPQKILQEKIDGIKNSKDISSEDKQKILGILKESFSKTIIKDQLDKLI